MKKITLIFVGLMLFTSITFACGHRKKKKDAAKKSQAVWMQYDETKCQNPWHFNWIQKPTEEQLRGAIQSHLNGIGIPISEIRSTYDVGLISCEACQCPNGRHYFVRVNSSEVEKLKALNFRETDKVPDVSSDVQTK
ncbi:MAG: hypothetical protein KDD21_06790 [Bacteroidetes bacterium]|nr:hypothetical protein [Bacteroidota bacterium]